MFQAPHPYLNRSKLNYPDATTSKNYSSHSETSQIIFISQALLLRLEHIFAPDEHSELSEPAEVKLNEIFSDLNFVSAVELSLGGNMELVNMERLHWNTERWNDDNHAATHPMADDDFDGNTVTLQPMQIRTFRLDLVAGTTNSPGVTNATPGVTDENNTGPTDQPGGSTDPDENPTTEDGAAMATLHLACIYVAFAGLLF